MAGPTITVAVLSDTTAAKKGLDDVAESAENVGRSVSRGSAEAGKGLDEFDGKANAAERGARGFADSLTGTSDVMGGLASGNLLQLGQGLADVFGAVQDLVLPLLGQMATKLGITTAATEAQTIAQEESNVAMAANPIGLVVLALVALAAAFYLAWTKSETFREIVTGAFDAVATAAQATFGWIRDNWPLLLGILTGGLSVAVIAIMRNWEDIRAGASRAFQLISDVVGPIIGAIHKGIDGIADAVGWLIHQVEVVIDKFQHIPGVGAVSSIGGAIGRGIGAVFADGGVVPGPAGRPMTAVVHGGEVVLNQQQQRALLTGGTGGGNQIIYYPTGYNRAAIVDAERRWARLNP